MLWSALYLVLGGAMTLSLRSRRHRAFAFAAICVGALVLQSCATQPPSNVPSPPGFLSGLLHGFLILFTFIGSLFTDYRIYAFPNSGVWYDLGYLLGAMAFLGGGGAGAKR
jgi:hypothetical protein